MLEIIKYNNEKQDLIKLMETLQDYLISIDPLKRLRRLPEYGEIYVNDLLEKIKENQGVIYIAKLDGEIVGLIAGLIEKLTVIDSVESAPAKTARILELIVSEKHRGLNIGTLLMSEIEKYFVEEKCNLIRVEVFEPNQSAHHFYEKCGYGDRVIDMLKVVQQ
jgi:ribosomal protein S18 acetylase RimI-like enzyme